MSDYTPTIGLEIHAELKTVTKMFCDSPNDPFVDTPNAHTCPVCLGHPGTLPVINKEAVRQVIRVGTALNGDIADYTEFDRKNYFYPDIPKGYQISQYKYPLVAQAKLAGVEITRIHLEEDTARSEHLGDGTSLVDFNRAGVPLMELVTEPVIHTASEATAFARELQLLLRYLGASEANMEKGEMRVEANISISKDHTLGTKVEVKNLNSFKVVELAIQYEIERQTRLLETGAQVEQETLGWDEEKQATYSQRKKENSHDYRYFPDPDLPKLDLSKIPEFTSETLEASLPELPWKRRSRLNSVLNNPELVETLTQSTVLGDFFDNVIQQAEVKENLVANYLTSDVLGLLKERNLSIIHLSGLRTDEFAEIMNMIGKSELSSRGAKDVLALWIEAGGSPRELAEKNGFIQKNNDQDLAQYVSEVVDSHKQVVEEYLAGKEAALQFLVGQGMKLSKGSANPARLRELIELKIKR